MVVVAAALRLWNLGHPRALVFDETYYVKDAYSLTRWGYEGTWGENANALFESGDTSALDAAASFVVHPPLGKWLISGGMGIGGVENPFYWRVTTALAGILAVWVLMMIARRLFDSTLLAVIAGLLFAVDGNAIVMSRVAILDNWLMLFALLGFAAVLADRSRQQMRLQAGLGNSGGSVFGPIVWWRPWVLIAGVCFGAASAVKWSGLWFLAAFGIYLVLVDVLARRQRGMTRWSVGALLRQGPVTALVLVIPALATYLASWTGWILSSGGYNRFWARDSGYSGPFPDWLASLWEYHLQAFGYHSSLATPHAYQANPWTWLFMIRPTSMFYVGSENGDAGCTFTACSQAITGIGNPLIWWAGAAALMYLAFRLVRRREWTVGIILTGMAAGYLPWLFYTHRTVFQFYSIVFEPYMILALTMCLGLILGTRNDVTWKRERGISVVASYLILVFLIAAFFYPLYTGALVPFEFWQAHMWLPGWR